MVRHRFLVPACKGSNPFTPDYEDPIGSVKNDYRGRASITMRSALSGCVMGLSWPGLFGQERGKLKGRVQECLSYFF